MVANVSAPGGFVPQAAVSFGAGGDAAVAVDAAHPLPVAVAGTTATYTDRSGTIAAGGTAQTLAATNAARRGFFIQNLSAGDLWVSSVGVAAAGAPCLRISAGQLYESPAHGIPGGAIGIFGATTGQSFAAREW